MLMLKQADIETTKAPTKPNPQSLWNISYYQNFTALQYKANKRWKLTKTKNKKQKEKKIRQRSITNHQGDPHKPLS